MKQIVVINTGGTFSFLTTEHGLAPGLSAEELKSKVGKMDPNIMLIMEDYCSLDSSNISPEDWCNLAWKVDGLLGRCDGIVIVHGTDTMAYTASMLSFMLQGIPIPVVLTGSQVSADAVMSDAMNNFKCAVSMAASGIGGVYVAFSHNIMLGCRASKVRTISFNAFESINYPNVGTVDAFGMHLNKSYAPPRKKYSPSIQYSNKIAVLNLFPGMKSDILSFLLKEGYEGVFIEGFGLGGVPFINSNLMAEIKKAASHGLPVLVGSQCRYEGSNLEIYEVGIRVLESGGIPVHDMTREAVVTKLMWCLGQTKDIKEVRSYFEKNLVQEVTLHGSVKKFVSLEENDSFLVRITI